MSSDLDPSIDLEPETDHVLVTVLKETTRAWLLQDSSAPERADYFPKSQIHFSRRNTRTGKALAVIPLWLLYAKGWNS